MGEGGSTAKCKLKRLLEQKTTEDHEVMSIAVLGLHDLRRLHHRAAHVDNVIGPVGGNIGVMVLQLPEPHGMNQVALFIVGCLPPQCFLDNGLFSIVILLAKPQKALLLRGLDYERAYCYHPVSFFNGYKETIFIAHVITTSLLLACSSLAEASAIRVLFC